MSCPQRHRARRALETSRRRLAAVVVPVLCCCLVVTGCSGDEEGDEPRSESSPTTSATSPSSSAKAKPPVRTVTQVGEVVGKLPKKTRRTASRRFSRIVDRWWREAYLAGRYPRQRFGSNVFPGFTPGARAQARTEMVLMSNAALASRVDTVTARKRQVQVDLLGVDGHVKGATARVRLVYATTGRRDGRFEVQGRLYLTPTDAGWRVFGYDMRRSEVRPPRKQRSGQGAKSGQKKSGRKQRGRKQQARNEQGRKKDGR